MAYDRALAHRVRRVLTPGPEITEREMFGGLAFLLHGKMFCGVVKDELMVRVGPATSDQALAKPHVRPMDFTGRPMKGYVFVAKTGLRGRWAIEGWTDWGMQTVLELIERGRRPKAPARRARAQRAPAKSKRWKYAPF